MPTEQKCPQCGTPLPLGALEGLCPACLLKQGATEDTATRANAEPFQPPSVEEVARLFPQLQVLELIGKGGMGAVYKARQPALDRVVALKILPPQAGRGPDFTERFNREARALAKLSHPNIVAVHEFGQVDGMPFFIMEFVDGLNLRQLERAGRLAPREALQIVPQICEALQFAHDEGIVHRDIKPENILLDKKGRVKIADFGIAKIMGADGRAGSPLPAADAQTKEGAHGVTRPTAALTEQAIGTPNYMAPEQRERPQSVDHRADIFSLGVVFYEMLTGELPVGKFAPPSRRVEVDVRLDEVVLRALEKEPERRFQNASQVRTVVETIASSRSSPAESETPEDYLARRASAVRRGALAGISVFLAVLILTVVLALLMQTDLYVGIARVKVFDGPPVPSQFEREDGLIKSDALLGRVAKSLELGKRWATRGSGVDVVPDEVVLENLRNSLTIRPIRNTSLVDISYTDKNPEEAKEIAGKIAEIYRASSTETHAEIVESGILEKTIRPDFIWICLPWIFVGAVLGFIVGFIVWGVCHVRLSKTAEYPTAPPNNLAPLASLAIFFAGMSGVLGTVAFCLFPHPPQPLVWEILICALAGIVLAIPVRDSKWGRQALIVGCVNVGIWLLIAVAFNAVHRVQRANVFGGNPNPNILLAMSPQELKSRPISEVVQAGLSNPEVPWPWQELEERTKWGRINTAEAITIVDDLTAWLRRDYPHGFEKPLYSIGDLLNLFESRSFIPETNALAFLEALYGYPFLEPLPRVRENGGTLQLVCRWRNAWDQNHFGFAMLNAMRSVSIDGKPVSKQAPFGMGWSQPQYTANIQGSGLAPGTHVLRCEIESALVPVEAMVGLAQNAPPGDWPPARKRWTRTCQAEFIVYSKDAEIVHLTKDPALNPVASGAVSANDVIIRPRNGRLSAVVSFKLNSKAESPVSADVTLRIAGQSVKCGRIFALKDGNTSSMSPSDFTVEIEPLDRRVKECEIVLTPNAAAVEFKAGVDRVWGEEIVLRKIPLVRQDLAADSKDPDVAGKVK